MHVTLLILYTIKEYLGKTTNSLLRQPGAKVMKLWEVAHDGGDLVSVGGMGGLAWSYGPDPQSRTLGPIGCGHVCVEDCIYVFQSGFKSAR